MSHVRDNVTLDGKEYKYAIGVHCLGDDGQWVIPSTWHDSPLEIPVGQINSHMQKYDEYQESLSESDQLKYRILKRNKSRPQDYDPMDEGADDERPSLDSVLLGDASASGLSLKEQIEQFMKSSEAAKIIEAATGCIGEKIDVCNALACFLGSLAGAELQLLSSSRDESKFDSC